MADFTIIQGRNTVTVNYRDVYYFKASHKYVDIYTKDAVYTWNGTVKELLDKHKDLVPLVHGTAVRKHVVKGYSTQQVISPTGNRNTVTFIHLTLPNHEPIRVSRRFAADIRKTFTRIRRNG